MNAKMIFGTLMIAALGTACGSSPDNAGDAEVNETATPTPAATAEPTPEPTPEPEPSPTPEPTPNATPTPAPTPTFADGIYVSRFGIDSNPGTGAQHVRTLRAAIERAKATAKKDIWLASDIDGWDWNEIVTVPDGINLHGGVCVAMYPMTPPAVIDPVACRTGIIGSSPALIADRITLPTLVENLEVRGRGIELDQEYAFKVPGGACLGRASATAAAGLNVTQACTPSADARSSFAAWTSSSSNLTFSNVRLVAAAAEAGRDGEDGVDGTDGIAASGQTAGVNADCAASNGGAGGNGGKWSYSTGHVVASIHAPTSGVAAPMAPATEGVAAANDLKRMSGASGTSAVASMPFAANVADSGTAAIDDATFVAGSGIAGNDGRDGAGGSGGGGGAVGVSFVFRYCATGDSTAACAGKSGWVAIGEGAITYDSAVVSSMPYNGETRGGAGGAGGAGGCGGTAAKAGQGGASSVALVVRSSQLTVKMSTLVTGNAGNGGKGGVGGEGGSGGNAVIGANGTATAQYNINGVVVLKPNTVPTVETLSGNPRINPNDTKGVSLSVGGNGGSGAPGQPGEAGATGGSGAGGASVGLFGIRSMVEVENVSYLLGNAGLGGTSDDGLARGENGIRAAEVAQD